jgi:hypothetical protein
VIYEWVNWYIVVFDRKRNTYVILIHNRMHYLKITYTPFEAHISTRLTAVLHCITFRYCFCSIEQGPLFGESYLIAQDIINGPVPMSSVIRDYNLIVQNLKKNYWSCLEVVRRLSQKPNTYSINKELALIVPVLSQVA